MLRRTIVLGLLVMLCGGVSLASGPERELRDELVRRRAQLMEKLGPHSMLILFSNDAKHLSADKYYDYRQENNLFYLTGIEQQGVTLVLMPGNERFKEILFLPRRDPASEVWDGRTLESQEAATLAGIANVWDTSEFDSFINAVCYRRAYRVNRYFPTSDYQQFFRAISDNKAEIYLLLDDEPGLHGALSREHEFARGFSGRFHGITIRNVTPIIARQRMIKSDFELRQIQRAIDVTLEALRAVMRELRAGGHEAEYKALVYQQFMKHQAFHPGIADIVASGPNATTLHYPEARRALGARELLLVDIGAVNQGYAADVTRTLPAEGKFTPEQAEIYQIVLDAQVEAAKVAKPGMTLADVHQRAVDVVKAGLLRAGLITDTSGDQYRIYFMHGTCHWLGLDMHDVGDRFTPLEPGMVFTIEPGIYVRADALDYLPRTPENEKFIAAVRPALERYKNIGVRIEDDFVVTADGVRLMSGALPRVRAELESLIQTLRQ